MSSTTCGSDVAANSLYGNLVTAGEFDIPAVDLSGLEFQIPDYSADPLFADITRLTEGDLTSREPRGTGMYDALMEANKAHLQEEFSSGRMTATEYREAYVALTTAAMSSAVQYLLSKDQAYYQSALVQHQAQMAKIGVINARVELETAKARLVEQQAATKTRAVQYALTKVQIASEDAKRCLTQAQEAQVTYETSNILPAQAAKIAADTTVSTAEELRIDAQTAQITYETANLLPEQLVLLQEQVETENAKTSDTMTDGVTPVAGVVKVEKDLTTAQISKVTADKDQVLYQTANILPEQLANLVKEKDIKTYQVDNILPAQVANTTADTVGKTYTNDFILPEQLELTRENVEAARAKTLDTRTDGTTPVAGSIGKQKELHAQQIKSYQDDMKWKVSKGILDTWITQKSLDEGLPAPTSLQDGSINSAMAAVRASVGL